MDKAAQFWENQEWKWKLAWSLGHPHHANKEEGNAMSG